MIKRFIILLLVALPLAIMGQDNDPFGGGSGEDPFGGGSDTSDPFGSSDDPFGDTTPADTPADTPTDTEVFTPDQPSDVPGGDGDPTTIDPFGAPTTTNNDPFGNGDDTFGAGDVPGLGTSTGGGDVFDNMVDTLSEPLVPEFPWEQKAIKERPVLNNYDIDESDVFWAKTVYREIDVREKMNHPFAYPRAPFMTILLDILKKDDSITVYKEDVFSGRDFSESSSWEQIETSLGNEREETIFDIDEFGNEVTTVEKIVDKFRVSKVKRFKIKEVWFFDKKHSRMKVRIMGIAPLMEVTAADMGANALLAQQMGLNSVTAQQTLFWVYYPDIREDLARYQTFNPLNDALRMSWDDLMSSRYFSSHITKVSNPLDRSIAEYTRNGMEALYESEEVKEEIFNFEHDLWTY